MSTDDAYPQQPAWGAPQEWPEEPRPAAPGEGYWGAPQAPQQPQQAQQAQQAQDPYAPAAGGRWPAPPQGGAPVGGVPWGEGTPFSQVVPEHPGHAGAGVTVPPEAAAAPGGPQVGLPWGEEAAAAVGAELDEAGYVWGLPQHPQQHSPSQQQYSQPQQYSQHPPPQRYPGGPASATGAAYAGYPESPAGAGYREQPAYPGHPVAGPTESGTGFVWGQAPAAAGGGAEHPAPAAAPATPAAPGVRRTGSPIVDPGLESAAGTLLLAVVLSGTAALGRPALAVGVVLLQAVTAAGWFRLNGMWPARQGILLAFLGGLVADAGALFAAGGGAAPGALLGALGAFFLLVLVLQVFRPSDPDERFYALTVCASATVVTVFAGGFLAALSTAHGKDTVVVGALAAAFSAMFAALATRALPAKAAFAIGWVVALAAGIALASAAGLGAGPGSALGAVAGGCGLLGRRVAAFDFPSRFVHRTAGVALPLACAGPLVLFLGVLG